MFLCENRHKFCTAKLKKEVIANDPETAVMEYWVCPVCGTNAFEKKEKGAFKQALPPVERNFRKMEITLLQGYGERGREYSRRVLEAAARYQFNRSVYRREIDNLKLEPSYRLNRMIDGVFDKTLMQYSADVRSRLKEKILMNFENGKKYPFDRLGIWEISISTFYRLKSNLLKGIGERMLENITL